MKDFQQACERLRELQQREDELKGQLKEILAQLEREHGIKKSTALVIVMKQRDEEVAKLERELAAKEKAFLRKWQNELE